MSETCSICGKASHNEYKPFCSKRCADIDLGRWLKGGYAIPTDEQVDPFEINIADPDG